MERLRELLTAALPGYEIGQEIGRGGLGVVYQGRHRGLGRAVAIKLLSSSVAADAGLRERFIFEARLVAALDHPHIVPVYDFVEHGGLCVIVMEFCGGGTLWSRFQTRGLRTDEAVAVVLAAAVGLHHAHSNGVLHRDVKPENILFSGAGTVKIADFGIAKSLAGDAGQRTATGSLIGTPAYMAPEQVTGDQLSPATDVYSLGVVLYELLTGQRPYRDVSEPMAQLFQHVHEDPRPMVEVFPGVPAQLEAVTRRALAKAPEDRPASAEQFAVELAEATTAMFGVGWLANSGTPVMSASSVIGATERIRGPLFGTAAAGSATGSAPGEWSGTPPAAFATPDPEMFSVLSGPAGATNQPTSKRSRRGRAAIIAVATLSLVTALLLVLRPFDSADTGPDQAKGAATTSSSASGSSTSLVSDEITAREFDQFRSRCTVYGVSEQRCRCAADRSVKALTPAQFRANLTVMADGQVTREVESILRACEQAGS